MLLKEQNKYQVYFLPKQKSRTLLKKVVIIRITTTEDASHKTSTDSN